MKTIRRDWLKRQIEAGLVEARCDYHYTDDYAQDAADNFGKSDFMPARIRRPKFEPRQIAEGVTRDVCVDDDAVQGNMNFRESDFTGSCGSCYWENEEKGLIHFSVHSNLSYTLRLKKQDAPAAAVALSTAATLTENNEKDGLEIRFASKPAAAVLARLKAAGWRWSRFGGCWYTRRTPGARKFAESLIGVSGAAVAPAASLVVVARYEDGEVYRTPLDEWTRENTEDEECAAALPRILAGETVNVGGGAAPLVTLSVERPSPAPAGEDYPCSDAGYEDACAARCGL